MGNEMTVQLTGGLKLQDSLLAELDKANQEFGRDFTDYGKQCVINAIASLVIYCKANDIDTAKLDPTLTRLALQNIGYTELNTAALPSECYFDIRKSTTWFEVDGKKQCKVSYSVAIKPQGAGNEKLVRKYGVGVQTLHNAWLVREGDDFTFPSFNGLKTIPPTWKPNSFDKKVIMVVYPLVKTDGTIEYLIATREGIKANLVAHIRQNTLYAEEFKDGNTLNKEKRDAFYEEVNKFAESHTLDEVISKYSKYINPTYISFGSKEQMLVRKMKNNALKNYPREFSDSYIKNAIENMFEDVDDSLKETKIVEVDPVAKVEQQISEGSKEDAIPDFEVQEEPTPQKEEAQPQPELVGAPSGNKDYGF